MLNWLVLPDGSTSHFMPVLSTHVLGHMEFPQVESSPEGVQIPVLGKGSTARQSCQDAISDKVRGIPSAG